MYNPCPGWGWNSQVPLPHGEFLQRCVCWNPLFRRSVLLKSPSTNRHKFSDLYHFVLLCLGSFIVSIKLVKGSSVPATLNDVCGFLDMWGLNCPVFSNKTIFKKRLLYNCPNSDILISLDRLDLPLCCVALD